MEQLEADSRSHEIAHVACHICTQSSLPDTEMSENVNW